MFFSEVDRKTTYSYSIQTVFDSLTGPPSPLLKFLWNKGFCGDGKIEKENGEECDDGNVRDGDGCNVRCKKEEVFHCDGQPSVCYKYVGDGKCEEFERQTSIIDCGFYTPKGFKDQWAIDAQGNPKYSKKKKCPEGVISGPPPLDLVRI